MPDAQEARGWTKIESVYQTTRSKKPSMHCLRNKLNEVQHCTVNLYKSVVNPTDLNPGGYTFWATRNNLELAFRQANKTFHRPGLKHLDQLWLEVV